MTSNQLAEEKFQQLFLSNKIGEIKIYQVNEIYFDMSENQHWIIDGGIEFKFGDKFFSIAWSSYDDCFHYDLKRVKEIYTGDNIFELKEGEIQKVKTFVGAKPADVKFKWQEYDVVLDYTMKTRKEWRLVEIKLEFPYDRKLQVSTIGYSLDAKKSPVDYTYLITEELLLSLKELEIKEKHGGLRPEY